MFRSLPPVQEDAEKSAMVQTVDAEEVISPCVRRGTTQGD